jgi:hypothetical protein
MDSLGTGLTPTFCEQNRRLCVLAMLQAMALVCWSELACAQAAPPSPALPPSAQPGAPAEIQPGHPVNGEPLAGGSGRGAGSGPQSAMPTPLPPGAKPDTPGGRASGGIANPPRHVDPQMNRKAPENGARGSVIPAPGTPGGRQDINPK